MRRRDAHRHSQCGHPLLCAESNKKGGPTVMGGVAAAETRYVPHRTTHPTPLTTSTQHVNDEGEWTTPHRRAQPPMTNPNQTVRTAATTTTNTNTNDEHKPEALCTHDNTNTKALARIGEGGGWFGGVSEVTTTVVAVPIPFHSMGISCLILLVYTCVDR